MKLDKNQFIRTLTLSIILGFIMIVIPLLMVLGKGSFSLIDLINKLYFYSIIGTAFLLLVIICAFIEYAIVNKDSAYGDSLLFASAGEKPALEVNFFKRTFMFALIFFIITSGIFLYTNVYNQEVFTGTVRLEQQFTPQDDLIFNTAIIPIAENLIPMFVVAFFLVFWRMYCRKKNINPGMFRAVALIGTVLLFMIVWFIAHQAHYGGSDIALTNVLAFGFVMGLLTALTGSFIPAWILHMNNNLFIGLSTLYSSDKILIGTVVTLIVLFILWVWLLFKRPKNKYKEV